MRPTWKRSFMPTLRRNTNVFARALGRPMVTDWLRERNVEGTVQIDDLCWPDTAWRICARTLLWDVGRVQLDGLQSRRSRMRPHRQARREPARVAPHL